MALLNPSFEDAGMLPGEAAHWKLSAVTRLEEIAGFGTAPEDAWEDFERWFEFLATIDDVLVVLAFFDSALKGYEQFESGWDNAVFLYELPPAQLVTATFDGRAAEDCETGWSNVPYAREWSEVASVTGVFGGEPIEDFRLRSYVSIWSEVPSSAAPIENFESAWTRATTQ